MAAVGLKMRMRFDSPLTGTPPVQFPGLDQFAFTAPDHVWVEANRLAWAVKKNASASAHRCRDLLAVERNEPHG